MVQKRLILRERSGNEVIMFVPNDVSIEHLETLVGRRLGYPVSRIVHQGRPLDKSRSLSNYETLNFNQPFYVYPWVTSGYQPSIVHMSNEEKARRRETLETHLENLMSPVPRGASMKRRSNIQKQLQETTPLNENMQRRVLGFLGGKRKKTRKSKKSKKQTRKNTRR